MCGKKYVEIMNFTSSYEMVTQNADFFYQHDRKNIILYFLVILIFLEELPLYHSLYIQER